MKKIFNRAKIKVVSKVLILFLLPILATFYLYPLKERVIFNGRDYQQTEFKIENLFQEKPTFKNLAADIFSVPLFLDWYKVSIVNNSTEENPNCLIGGEPPTVFFTFLEGDPRIYYSNLKETTVYTGGYSESGPGHPSYYVKSGDEAFFIAPSWKDYSIDGGLIFGGDCELALPMMAYDNFKMVSLLWDYDISIKPYWISWFVRMLIIFVFWVFLLSSVISTLNWLKKDR